MANVGNKEVMSKNIKFYVEKINKDRREICKDLNVSYSTFSDWYNGNKYPRIDKIEAMANYFGVQKSDLIEEHSNSNVINISGMIPIVGKIPAGYPVLAQENIEGYMPTMVNNPDEYFYLRVSGVSMVNAGIPDGSLVLIHKQPCAENGEVVACRVNGDEATLKRFKPVNKNTVVLMPENPDFQPIIVSTNDFNSGYAEIIGVAKQVITNL
ncbi:LexA family protein [Caproicibacterium amylolyticum]|uniref:Transcriptional regulator n=1 Tax=Caproicibacterium amylolyticum TaxID=2766537 RepID=A0A7G9WJI4_9FIRM|nr:S24 family peptidase [Caproicibacterium amylolyticum]QNO18846.1 transcriptional regulator [Caproicibacterium amylolyticum]